MEGRIVVNIECAQEDSYTDTRGAHTAARPSPLTVKRRAFSSSSTTSAGTFVDSVSDPGSPFSDIYSPGLPFTPRDGPTSDSADVFDDYFDDAYEYGAIRALRMHHPTQETYQKQHNHKTRPTIHIPAIKPIILVRDSSPIQSHEHHHHHEHKPPSSLSTPPIIQQRVDGNSIRRALCIGIDYEAEKRLNGCVYDARRVRDLLIKHGYDPKNIVTLTDDGQSMDMLPTKENMLREMKNLVKDAKAGDRFFLHFSGHGEQVKDNNGDEVDGFDEGLVPSDWKQAGLIIDDELNKILITPLPEGCRLTALIDACHSGTVLDLPYNYYCNGTSDGLSVCTKKFMYLPADVTSWSGCADMQSSQERLNKEGKSCGVMTNAFISCIEEDPTPTYQDLYDNLMGKMKYSFIQCPQLGTSKEIDASQIFEF